METLKNVVAVLAGLIGLVTGLLTLYAKYLDVKKSAAGDVAVTSVPEPARPAATPAFDSVEEPSHPPEIALRPGKATPEMIERSRAAVRPPAVALLATGLISLFFNLVVAAYGYVDRYVTPLSEERQTQRATEAAARTKGEQLHATNTDGLSEDATVVLTICATLSLAIGSAAAAWGGFGMLRLRGYWLSVAGSIAIMGGGSTCCMIGIPIGLWSLAILYRPEVSASFRGS